MGCIVLTELCNYLWLGGVAGCVPWQGGAAGWTLWSGRAAGWAPQLYLIRWGPKLCSPAPRSGRATGWGTWSDRASGSAPRFSGRLLAVPHSWLRSLARLPGQAWPPAVPSSCVELETALGSGGVVVWAPRSGRAAGHVLLLGRVVGWVPGLGKAVLNHQVGP